MNSSLSGVVSIFSANKMNDDTVQVWFVVCFAIVGLILGIKMGLQMTKYSMLYHGATPIYDVWFYSIFIIPPLYAITTAMAALFLHQAVFLVFSKFFELANKT